MIKIPNHTVIVPVTPDLILYTKPRKTNEGSRKHLSYVTNVVDVTTITLPWLPIAQNWVEVYTDNIRVVNPRIKGISGGDQFEVYNVKNNHVIFNTPVTGEIKIICDTDPTHYWDSLIISGNNIQGTYVYSSAHYIQIDNWKVTAGSARGRSYNVYFEPGPEFQVGSHVIIKGCEPDVFNGNFQVGSSTLESVSFVSSVLPQVTSIVVRGLISGFGNVTYKQLQGVSLYTEPVIITQPAHGYARLTTDRKAIAYVPNVNFKGIDTFSWSMINQRGQVGTPKCVQINVRD
jgi:hypothetical protein